MRVSTLPGLTSKSIRTNKCQKVPYPWRASAQKKLTVPLLGPSTRVRCDHVLTAHIEARSRTRSYSSKRWKRNEQNTKKCLCRKQNISIQRCVRAHLWGGGSPQHHWNLPPITWECSTKGKEERPWERSISKTFVRVFHHRQAAIWFTTSWLLSGSRKRKVNLKNFCESFC